MLNISCVILDLSNIWPGQINFVYFRERGHLRPLVIELQISLVIVSLIWPCLFRLFTSDLDYKTLPDKGKVAKKKYDLLSLFK